MYESLRAMPLRLQMQNVGAEVSRVVRFKESDKYDRAVARAHTAIDMLEEMCHDPKNAHRIGEFRFMQEELSDYISTGQTKYDIDPMRLVRQYEIFSDI